MKASCNMWPGGGVSVYGSNVNSTAIDWISSWPYDLEEARGKKGGEHQLPASWDAGISSANQYLQGSSTTPGVGITPEERATMQAVRAVDGQDEQEIAFLKLAASMAANNGLSDEASAMKTLCQAILRAGDSLGGPHLAAGAASAHDAVSSRYAKSSLYKTELCRSWLELGCCRYGAKCQFAHGVHELRPVPRHPKYKTQLCRSFISTGVCPYGKRCRFIHLPVPPPPVAAAAPLGRGGVRGVAPPPGMGEAQPAAWAAHGATSVAPPPTAGWPSAAPGLSGAMHMHESGAPLPAAPFAGAGSAAGADCRSRVRMEGVLQQQQQDASVAGLAAHGLASSPPLLQAGGDNVPMLQLLEMLSRAAVPPPPPPPPQPQPQPQPQPHSPLAAQSAPANPM